MLLVVWPAIVTVSLGVPHDTCQKGAGVALRGLPWIICGCVPSVGSCGFCSFRVGPASDGSSALNVTSRTPRVVLLRGLICLRDMPEEVDP